MKSSGHSYTEGQVFEDNDIEDFGQDTTVQMVVKVLIGAFVLFMLGFVVGGVVVYHSMH